jgi:hypothetical protein
MKITSAVLLSMVCLASVTGIAATGKDPSGQGLVGRLEVGPATVGKPVEIQWTLAGAETRKAVVSPLSLTIIQLEEGRRIFSLFKVPSNGNFTMSFQFTDGSDHLITAVAELEDGPPIVAEKIISVTALEPSLRAILPALFLFLAVIALGLVAGRTTRRRIRS